MTDETSRSWPERQWDRFLHSPVETRVLISAMVVVLFVVLATIAIVLANAVRKVEDNSDRLDRCESSTTIVSDVDCPGVTTTVVPRSSTTATTGPTTTATPGAQGPPGPAGPPGTVVIVPSPSPTTQPPQATTTTTRPSTTTTTEPPCNVSVPGLCLGGGNGGDRSSSRGR